MQSLSTCTSPQFLLRSSSTCILASSIIVAHTHCLPQEKQQLSKRKKITKFQSRQSMRPEKKYHFLPYPPFYFPLPVLQRLSPLLLRLIYPPSVFLSLRSPIPPLILSLTPATKFIPHWNLPPPCQQASLTPLQSSGRPSSGRSTHSGHLVSLESSPSTPCPSVVSLSSHWTSWPFPPWLSLVPCPCRRAYRQPWPWHKERRKLRDYKKKLAEKETIQTIPMAKFEEYT